MYSFPDAVLLVEFTHPSLNDAFNAASSFNVIKMVVPPKPFRFNIWARANSADSFGVESNLLNMLKAFRLLRHAVATSSDELYLRL